MIYSIEDSIEDSIGDLIARGRHREVYNYKIDKELVVKLRVHKRDTSNEIEWKLYNLLKSTIYGNSFCPCLWVSSDYKYLIAKKAISVPDLRGNRNKVTNEELDTINKITNEIKSFTVPLLPAGLKDAFIGRSDNIEPTNWGILGNKIVLIDYGHYANRVILNNLSKQYE